jgi:NAD(P)H-hydrate epimerase
LDCDTGAVADSAITADLTVTLAAAKPVLLRFPGAASVGEIVVADICGRSDMKELTEVQMELADSKTVRPWLPPRPPDSHKGTFGTAVIAAGSVNYPGSAGLAAAGAYRVGAGLVCLAVPGVIHGLLVSLVPEATWLILPQETGVIAEGAADVLRGRVSGVEVLLIGPGIGREATTGKFLARLLQPAETGGRAHIGFIHDQPEAVPNAGALPQLIVDADGLRLLAELEGWPGLLPPGTILTPHPGEMALTGLDTANQPRGVARDWALVGPIVVLRLAYGYRTPDGLGPSVPTAALAKTGRMCSPRDCRVLRPRRPSGRSGCPGRIRPRTGRCAGGGRGGLDRRSAGWRRRPTFAGGHR